ncbi:hypothetical protein QR680_015418 [Steinernema hermaphroditum]|uniref:DAGKc domain-containing protein n=1 Tax=Steinernema hermaphroditum TaxID=289476 RepID=A0AA39H8M4_9BILA|nr:hypothetical protein QR680_015418 [Steinernema hermaphroditum]
MAADVSSLRSNISSSHAIHMTTIQDTDGEYHRMTLDDDRNVLYFAPASDSVQDTVEPPTPIELSEVVAVKGSRIKLRYGLPVNLEPNLKNAPDELYFYIAFKRDKYRWRLREVTYTFMSPSDKAMWLDLLCSTIRKIKCRPQTLLVFVNPFGGNRRAKRIYKRQVEPLLELAEIEYKLILTERANHAFDVITNLSEESWTSIDGIVAVGGDGLFNEILCAAVKRAQLDVEKDIADGDISSLETPPMRFGIIAAGSANSIVSSIHGIDDGPTAAIHIAIGSRCYVDAATVHEGDNLLRISANAMSYGWLGDVARHSEKYRCMGPFRYNWSALRTTIRHPKYFGRVDFCLAKNVDPPAEMPKCSYPCVRCETEDFDDEIYPYHVTSDFTHLICCVMPCVSAFSPYGLAPFAGIGDGSMDLAMVCNVSRFANLEIMLKVFFNGGQGLVPFHRNVKVFRVSRFSFTPANLLRDQEEYAKRNKQSTWNLDGEVVPQSAWKTLHFRLHSRLISFFGREVDLKKPTRRHVLCC